MLRPQSFLPQPVSLESPKRGAVFFDRDGTLNVYKPYLSKLEDFHLAPLAREAVAEVKKAGYWAIVVTNQPMLAMKLCSKDTVEAIHGLLIEQTLSQGVGGLDGIYFCPHTPHFQEGYVKNLCGDCECRKPRLGMIHQACKDFPIDLQRSFMIGDTWRDIEFGINGGLMAALGLSSSSVSLGNFNSTKPSEVFDNILAAVQYGLKESRQV